MLISNDDIRKSSSIKYNATDKTYQVVVRNDTGSYFNATFESLEAAEIFVNEWMNKHE